jgi:hypothetical protein
MDGDCNANTAMWLSHIFIDSHCFLNFEQTGLAFPVKARASLRFPGDSGTFIDISGRGHWRIVGAP